VDAPGPEPGPGPRATDRPSARAAIEAAAEPLDHTKLAAARLRAAGMQPFLAMALYALTPVPDGSRPTFSVDERWRLYINPAKLREWPVPQVAGALLHEVGHVVRDHAGRARTAIVTGEREARLWNIAGDAEINDDLLDAEVELPANPVTPDSLGLPRHKAAEFYYARLTAAADPPESDPGCGSGSNGRDEADQSGADGLLPPGLSDVEALLLRRRIAEVIASIEASQPGTLGGGWIRWAHAILRPQLDWRRLLAAKIRSSTAAVAGSADYSYAKPSRRHVPGVVLPSLLRPIPRVAIVIDTSGSVSADQLAVAWSEVHGCLRSLGIRRDMLTVYAADAEIHRITGRLTRRAGLAGGGGTDMAAAIEHVARARPRPDLIVVITDGLTRWPPRPGPGVIVALLPGPATPPQPPSWAQVIRVQ
jgi:predicted metal-dependent peptidase